MTDTNAARIVIAGASGFVGMELLRRLSGHYQIIALTRSTLAATALPEHTNTGIYWLQCNLFSLKQTETALVGSQAAYFMVHSMSPAARLTQGQYSDLDLLIADNFSRAAASAGIKRIIYLGGIQPQGNRISDHLRSRLEVEQLLNSRCENFVALRAGLILGAGGSSSSILVRLVQRLPALVCPSWTLKLSSPVSLADTADALVECLKENDVAKGSYDLSGPEIISYRSLMQRTAEELGVRRLFIPFVGVPPRLSLLWVRLITGASKELVAPLIQSLLVDMLPGKTAPVFSLTKAKVRLTLALHQAELPPVKLPIGSPNSAHSSAQDDSDAVVSIQRLARPHNWTATDVANDYANWLSRFLRPFLKIRHSENREILSFVLRGFNNPMLILRYVTERSDDRRALFFVQGGALRRKNSNPAARLEFRICEQQKAVLAAVLDFHPALPWPVYLSTQAVAHRIIMWRYAARLAKISSKMTV